MQSAVGLSLFAITSAGWIAAHSPQADVHSPHWPAHTNRWFSILSVMEKRRVDNDHTVPWRGVKWQIPREAIQRGMRGSTLRIEQRLDGSIMARVQAKFITLERCLDQPKVKPAPPTHRSSRRFQPAPGQSRWMDQFRVKGNAAWHAYREEQSKTQTQLGTRS